MALKDGGRMEVLEVDIHKDYTHVYSLTVANAHTFYISDAGVLVHNESSTPCEPPAILGGTYEEVRGWADNYARTHDLTKQSGQVHHMPARGAIKNRYKPNGQLVVGDMATNSSSIWMTAANHRNTASYGSRVYVRSQREIIDRGNWCEAIRDDVIDLTRVPRVHKRFKIVYGMGVGEMMLKLPTILGVNCEPEISGVFWPPH